MTTPVRIGLIVPSGGAEADYYSFEEATAGAVKIFLTISQVGGESGQDHEIEALKQTAQVPWLVEAGERIRSLRLDAIHWACTSGSFVLGRSFAEGQSAQLGAALGLPASSTSLAFAAASAHLGLRRVAVLATYPEDVAGLFCSFLEEYGIGVDAVHWMGAPSGWDAARFGEDLITANTRKVAGPGIDAVLIPDTALPSLHFLERLETAVGVPVLTANAVTMWDAQQIAGRITPVKGFGRLLGG